MTLKHVTLIYCIVLCLFGCGADEEISPSDTMLPTGAELEQSIEDALDIDELETRSPLSGGGDLYYEPNQDKPYTGWVKQFFEDEQVQMLAQVHNGKLHGVYRISYVSGQKYVEGTFNNGRKEGVWTTWYINGQKISEGTYKNGEREGVYTAWHLNGKKAIEGTYKDDEEDGKWTSWYENGQKRSEGTYTDGQENDDWRNWLEDGEEV